MNIENDAWMGEGDTRSPFPAQVRCEPTRVQGSLSAAACRNWIRRLRPLADDSANKKFRLDLNPAETAAFINMFVFGVKDSLAAPTQPQNSGTAASGHRDADGWETVGPKKKEVNRKDGRASSGQSRSLSRESITGGRKAISNAGDTSGADTPDEEPGSPAAPRTERAPTGWAAILTGRADSASLPTSAAEAAAKETAAKEAERLRIKEQEAEKIRKEKEQAKARAEAERISSQPEAPGSPKTEPKRVASPAPRTEPKPPVVAVKETVGAPAQGPDGASKPFMGWASVVTGATPDPAKEGWHTLVEGKLDAEKHTTATVTITSIESVGGSSIDAAAVKKASPAEQVSRSQSPRKSPASSVENEEMAPLKKAWSGWAVKNPPPMVDLKAEMEEEAKKAATKVKAVTIDPSSGAEDGSEGKKKEGKKEKKEKKDKDGGDGKGARGVPQPQRGKNAQGANAAPLSLIHISEPTRPY